MMRSRCRSCGAEIIWAQPDRTGSVLPLNAEPEPEPAARLVALDTDGGCRVLRTMDVPAAKRAVKQGTITVHRSHFATCPQAGHWRGGGAA